MQIFWHSSGSHDLDYCNSLSIIAVYQGWKLGGRGIVPLKYLCGGDGCAFIPLYLENVIAHFHSKRDSEREKLKIRYQ